MGTHVIGIKNADTQGGINTL